MANRKIDPESILNDVRRALGTATTAQQVLDAGKPLPDLINAIEATMDGLDDQIAAEAESIDRRRTNELRVEKSKASDMLTDAENLGRRLDERHKAAIKSDTDEAMRAAMSSALEKRAEALALILKLEEPMRAIVAGATRYLSLMKEIDQLRERQLAAGRNDLRIPHVWSGLVQSGDDFGHIFDFLREGNLMTAYSGSNFFKAVDRVKNAGPALTDKPLKLAAS